MKQVKYFFVPILFLFICCTEQKMHHSYHHFRNEIWDKNDIVHLNLFVTDSLDKYEVHFIVRNSSAYPYQNLPLSIEYNFPDTALWTTDTLEFVLSNKDGKWLGSGWADLYQSTFLLKEAPVQDSTGYIFKVKHLLDDDQLRGINDIGIQIKGNK